MSDPERFSCPSCGQSYKRGNLPAGKKVKCRKCETVITIPAADEPEPLEELEELSEEIQEEVETPEEESVAAAPSRQTGSRARAGSRRAGAASSRSAGSRARRGRPAPEKKSSATPLLIGGGALIVLVLGLWLGGVFGGGKPKDNGQGQGGQQAKQPEKPKEKTPAEKYDAALADAAKAGDKKAQAEAYARAIDLLESETIENPRLSTEDLHKKIVEIDPENATSRSALGFMKYQGDFEKYKGQWVTRAVFEKIPGEYKAWKEKQARKKEELRWTKDAFAKKAAKLRDYFDGYAEKVKDFNLKYFFDTEAVPRPYLFMVQDATAPDPAQTAEILGRGLSQLRAAFRKDYPGEFLPSWDDSKDVVPILCFKSADEYERYRVAVPKHAGPSSKMGVGAFYMPQTYDDAPKGVYRGILFVWQGNADRRFYGNVYHEATHQLMHNASIDGQIPRSPWLQEGIAEFWSGFEGNYRSGIKWKQFQEDRYQPVQQAAEMYYQKKQDGSFFFSPKKLVSISRQEFDIWRTRRKGSDMYKVQLIYAEGWAFNFFSNYFEDEDYEGKDPKKKFPYREPFRQVIYNELRHQLTPEKVAELYEMKTDADWDKLAKDFFFFCRRTLRTMR